ncbi:hypothetical protein OFN61_37380, partial [Escherichia coli]|nr:hypothetical protein [Escherichia coli]
SLNSFGANSSSAFFPWIANVLSGFNVAGIYLAICLRANAESSQMSTGKDIQSPFYIQQSALESTKLLPHIVRENCRGICIFC